MRVLYVAQAPAVDVLAIGFADGRIVLHHLKHDKTMMEFKQDWGEVTALSFRTGTKPKHSNLPPM
jgi:U3 small nucleolar RNA-associated protein 21